MLMKIGRNGDMMLCHKCQALFIRKQDNFYVTVKKNDFGYKFWLKTDTTTHLVAEWWEAK